MQTPRFKITDYVAFLPRMNIPNRFNYIKQCVFQVVSMIDDETSIKYVVKIIDGDIVLPENAQFILPEEYLCKMTKQKIENPFNAIGEINE